MFFLSYHNVSIYNDGSIMRNVDITKLRQELLAEINRLSQEVLALSMQNEKLIKMIDNARLNIMNRLDIPSP